MKETERYKGLAPMTERSFTVPATASFPMSPPLKKMGETVKLSVEKTSFPDSSRTAPSSSLFSMGFPKYFKNKFFINFWVSSPPVPWANRIFPLI